MMMKVDWNCPRYRITCHWLLFKRLNITRYVAVIIACMTVVGDTPDIDFRYIRGFYILSLAYNIKMIECVVKISLNLLIKVSKIHSNNSNWTFTSIIVWHSYICCTHLMYCRNRRGRDRMVVGFIITYAISAHHVSSNPVHGEVYSIQHYVIKSVSDLRQVGGFLRFPPPMKLTATI